MDFRVSLTGPRRRVRAAGSSSAGSRRANETPVKYRIDVGTAWGLRVGNGRGGARTEPERHIQTLSITCVILSEALFAT